MAEKEKILKSVQEIIKNKPFFKNVGIKDIKFTDGLGNGQVIIDKGGIEFTLAAFFSPVAFVYWFMSEDEMEKQFEIYKNKYEQ